MTNYEAKNQRTLQVEEAVVGNRSNFETSESLIFNQFSRPNGYQYLTWDDTPTSIGVNQMKVTDFVSANAVNTVLEMEDVSHIFTDSFDMDSIGEDWKESDSDEIDFTEESHVNEAEEIETAHEPEEEASDSDPEIIEREVPAVVEPEVYNIEVQVREELSETVRKISEDSEATEVQSNEIEVEIAQTGLQFDQVAEPVVYNIKGPVREESSKTEPENVSDYHASEVKHGDLATESIEEAKRSGLFTRFVRNVPSFVRKIKEGVLEVASSSIELLKSKFKQKYDLVSEDRIHSRSEDFSAQFKEGVISELSVDNVGCVESGVSQEKPSVLEEVKSNDASNSDIDLASETRQDAISTIIESCSDTIIQSVAREDFESSDLKRLDRQLGERLAGIQEEFSSFNESLEAKEGELASLNANIFRHDHKDSRVRLKPVVRDRLHDVSYEKDVYESRCSNAMHAVREKLAGERIEVTEEVKAKAAVLVSAGLPLHEKINEYISFSEVKRKLIGLATGNYDKGNENEAFSNLTDDANRQIKKFKHDNGSKIYLVDEDTVVIKTGEFQIHVSNLHNGRVKVRSFQNGAKLIEKSGVIASYEVEKLAKLLISGKGLHRLKKVTTDLHDSFEIYIPPVDIEARLNRGEVIGVDLLSNKNRLVGAVC